MDIEAIEETTPEPTPASLPKEIFIPLDDSSILTWIFRVGGKPLED